MYQLEDRILFDAALAGDINDAQENTQPDGDELQDSNTDPNKTQENVDGLNPVIPDDFENGEVNSPLLDSPLDTQDTGSVNVLVVSESLKNLDALLNSVSENTIVITYNPYTTSGADLLKQITDALGGLKANSIGFLTDEAENNRFTLISDSTTALDTLANDEAQQAFWSGLDDILTEDGRIDLFTSNLASTETGKEVVDTISELTGHTVAASEDITGDPDANGNWELEYVTGRETSIDVIDEYFDALALDSFDARLENPMEIVFIDSSIRDIESILAGLNRDVEVVLIDKLNGFDQITDYLRNRTNIDAIHIFSHGSNGQFKLGGDIIDSEFINTRLSDFGIWGDAMNPNGDIMLYGCSIAADETGQEFVQSLADATGVDIAASTDRTGHLGNWDLEFTVGAIETSAFVISDYQQALRDAKTFVLQSLSDFPVNPALTEDCISTLREAIYFAIDGDTITFSYNKDLMYFTYTYSYYQINEDGEYGYYEYRSDVEYEKVEEGEDPAYRYAVNKAIAITLYDELVIDKAITIDGLIKGIPSETIQTGEGSAPSELNTYDDYLTIQGESWNDTHRIIYVDAAGTYDAITKTSKTETGTVPANGSIQEGRTETVEISQDGNVTKTTTVVVTITIVNGEYTKVTDTYVKTETAREVVLKNLYIRNGYASDGWDISESTVSDSEIVRLPVINKLEEHGPNFAEDPNDIIVTYYPSIIVNEIPDSWLTWPLTWGGERNAAGVYDQNPVEIPNPGDPSVPPEATHVRYALYYDYNDDPEDLEWTTSFDVTVRVQAQYFKWIPPVEADPDNGVSAVPGKWEYVAGVGLENDTIQFEVNSSEWVVWDDTLQDWVANSSYTEVNEHLRYRTRRYVSIYEEGGDFKVSTTLSRVYYEYRSAEYGTTNMGHGGAIYIAEGSTVNIQNMYLYNNKAAYDGGAIYNAGTLIIGSKIPTDGNYSSVGSTSFAFFSNEAGMLGQGSGGAIYNAGLLVVSGSSADLAPNALFYDSEGVPYLTESEDGTGPRLQLDWGRLGNATINGFWIERFSHATSHGIHDNVANGGSGGGIYSDNGNIYLSGFLFQRNTAAGGSGGALFINGAYNQTNDIVFSQLNFVDNMAYLDGGALYYMNGSRNLDMIFCDFTGNYAGGSGGALYLYNNTGSVNIYAMISTVKEVTEADGSTTTVTTTIYGNGYFLGNRARMHGGAIYIEANDGDVSIQQQYLYNNDVLSGEGGAIYIKNSGNVSFHESAFAGNYSFSKGAAVYYESDENSSLSINNTTFMYNSFYSSNSAGGALYIDKGNVLITNSTFIYNAAAQTLGGAIYMNMGNLNIQNSTFAYNKGTAAHVYINGSSTKQSVFAVSGSIFFNFDNGATFGYDAYNRLEEKIDYITTREAYSSQIYIGTNIDSTGFSTVNNIYSHYYLDKYTNGSNSLVLYNVDSNRLIGSTSTKSTAIQKNLFLDVKPLYQGSGNTYTLAIVSDLSWALAANGAQGSYAGYDQRGNMRAGVIGAFEPIFHTNVTSKLDDKSYTSYNDRTFYDLALDAAGTGLTFRYALYWIDTRDGLLRLRDLVLTINGISESLLNENDIVMNPDGSFVYVTDYLTNEYNHRHVSFDPVVFAPGQDNTIHFTETIYTSFTTERDVAVNFLLFDENLNVIDADHTFRFQDDASRIAFDFSQMAPDNAFYVEYYDVIALNNITIRGAVGDPHTTVGVGLFTEKDSVATLFNVVVTENQGFILGAGIYNTGTMYLYKSTVSHNTMTTGSGAGIYNAGKMYIEQSAIMNNTINKGINGAGIYHEGVLLVIANSTIAYNHIDARDGASAEELPDENGRPYWSVFRSMGSAIYSAATLVSVNNTIVYNTIYTVGIPDGEDGLTAYVFQDTAAVYAYVNESANIRLYMANTVIAENAVLSFGKYYLQSQRDIFVTGFGVNEGGVVTTGIWGKHNAVGGYNYTSSSLPGNYGFDWNNPNLHNIVGARYFSVEESVGRVLKATKDENGEWIKDDDGNIIYSYVYAILKDPEGNPILDAEGKPQKIPVRDENGEIIPDQYEWETEYSVTINWGDQYTTYGLITDLNLAHEASYNGGMALSFRVLNGSILQDTGSTDGFDSATISLYGYDRALSSLVKTLSRDQRSADRTAIFLDGKLVENYFGATNIGSYEGLALLVIGTGTDSLNVRSMVPVYDTVKGKTLYYSVFDYYNVLDMTLREALAYADSGTSIIFAQKDWSTDAAFISTGDLDIRSLAEYTTSNTFSSIDGLINHYVNVGEGNGSYIFDGVNQNYVGSGYGSYELVSIGAANVIGNNTFRLLKVESSAPTSTVMTIKNMTFSYGNAGAEDGGAIWFEGNLTLNNVLVSNSTATQGGGIYLTGGQLYLAASTIRNNTAKIGGGVYVGTYVAADTSGNYYPEYLYTLKVENTYILGNTATGDGGDVVGGGGTGGGIYVRSGAVNVSYSTVAYNAAKTDGGGLYIGVTGSLTLLNSTFSNNTAGYQGGAIAYYSDAALKMDFVTIANNQSGYYNGKATQGLPKYGGGVFMNNGKFAMNNSIIAQNYRGSILDAVHDDIYVRNGRFTARTSVIGSVLASDSATVSIDAASVRIYNTATETGYRQGTDYLWYEFEGTIDTTVSWNGGHTPTVHILAANASRLRIANANGVAYYDQTHLVNYDASVGFRQYVGAYEIGGKTFIHQGGEITGSSQWINLNGELIDSSILLSASDAVFIIENDSYLSSDWILNPDWLDDRGFSDSSRIIIRNGGSLTVAEDVLLNAYVVIETGSALMLGTTNFSKLRIAVGDNTTVGYISERATQNMMTRNADGSDIIYNNLYLAGGNKTYYGDLMVEGSLTFGSAGIELTIDGTLDVMGSVIGYDASEGINSFISTTDVINLAGANAGSIIRDVQIIGVGAPIMLNSGGNLTLAGNTQIGYTYGDDIHIHNTLYVIGENNSLIVKEFYKDVTTNCKIVIDGELSIDYGVQSLRIGEEHFRSIVLNPDGTLIFKTEGTIEASITEIPADIQGTLGFYGYVTVSSNTFQFGGNTKGLEFGGHVTLVGDLTVNGNISFVGNVVTTGDTTITSTGSITMGRNAGDSIVIGPDGNDILTLNAAGNITVANITAYDINVMVGADIIIGGSLVAYHDLVLNQNAILSSKQDTAYIIAYNSMNIQNITRDAKTKTELVFIGYGTNNIGDIHAYAVTFSVGEFTVANILANKVTNGVSSHLNVSGTVTIYSDDSGDAYVRGSFNNAGVMQTNALYLTKGTTFINTGTLTVTELKAVTLDADYNYLSDGITIAGENDRIVIDNYGILNLADAQIDVGVIVPLYGDLWKDGSADTLFTNHQGAVLNLSGTLSMSGAYFKEIYTVDGNNILVERTMRTGFVNNGTVSSPTGTINLTNAFTSFSNGALNADASLQIHEINAASNGLLMNYGTIDASFINLTATDGGLQNYNTILKAAITIYGGTFLNNGTVNVDSVQMFGKGTFSNNGVLIANTLTAVGNLVNNYAIYANVINVDDGSLVNNWLIMNKGANTFYDGLGNLDIYLFRDSSVHNYLGATMYANNIYFSANSYEGFLAISESLERVANAGYTAQAMQDERDLYDAAYNDALTLSNGLNALITFMNVAPGQRPPEIQAQIDALISYLGLLPGASNDEIFAAARVMLNLDPSTTNAELLSVAQAETAEALLVKGIADDLLQTTNTETMNVIANISSEAILSITMGSGNGYLLNYAGALLTADRIVLGDGILQKMIIAVNGFDYILDMGTGLSNYSTLTVRGTVTAPGNAGIDNWGVFNGTSIIDLQGSGNLTNRAYAEFQATSIYMNSGNIVNYSTLVTTYDSANKFVNNVGYAIYIKSGDIINSGLMHSVMSNIYTGGNITNNPHGSFYANSIIAGLYLTNYGTLHTYGVDCITVGAGQTLINGTLDPTKYYYGTIITTHLSAAGVAGMGGILASEINNYYGEITAYAIEVRTGDGADYNYLNPDGYLRDENGNPLLDSQFQNLYTSGSFNNYYADMNVFLHIFGETSSSFTHSIWVAGDFRTGMIQDSQFYNIPLTKYATVYAPCAAIYVNGNLTNENGIIYATSFKVGANFRNYGVLNTTLADDPSGNTIDVSGTFYNGVLGEKNVVDRYATVTAGNATITVRINADGEGGNLINSFGTITAKSIEVENDLINLGTIILTGNGTGVGNVLTVYGNLTSGTYNDVYGREILIHAYSGDTTVYGNTTLNSGNFFTNSFVSGDDTDPDYDDVVLTNFGYLLANELNASNVINYGALVMAGVGDNLFKIAGNYSNGGLVRRFDSNNIFVADEYLSGITISYSNLTIGKTLKNELGSITAKTGLGETKAIAANAIINGSSTNTKLLGGIIEAHVISTVADFNNYSGTIILHGYSAGAPGVRTPILSVGGNMQNGYSFGRRSTGNVYVYYGDIHVAGTLTNSLGFVYASADNGRITADGGLINSYGGEVMSNTLVTSGVGITNSGTLTIISSITSDKDILNSGAGVIKQTTFVLTGSASLINDSQSTITASTITLENGDLRNSGTLTANGGGGTGIYSTVITLSGSGNINNSGTLIAGAVEWGFGTGIINMGTGSFSNAREVYIGTLNMNGDFNNIGASVPVINAKIMNLNITGNHTLTNIGTLSTISINAANSNIVNGSYDGKTYSTALIQVESLQKLQYKTSGTVNKGRVQDYYGKDLVPVASSDTVEEALEEMNFSIDSNLVNDVQVAHASPQNPRRQANMDEGSLNAFAALADRGNMQERNDLFKSDIDKLLAELMVV